ncbi:hypothetical protein [Streptomyces sp. NPDC051162]|uniref:hypothetical protein n=1 Tax=unclassified Streptomyces TaxID=2593676 RepID=UPI00341D0B50
MKIIDVSCGLGRQGRAYGAEGDGRARAPASLSTVRQTTAIAEADTGPIPALPEN